MRLESPLQTLHEALASALLRDLPDISYETRDWKKVEQLRKKLSVEEYGKLQASDQLPTKKCTRRPETRDVEVVMFAQTWGSTALGYGGIGGAAMTSAYTVVATMNQVACVYFGCGRLAYQLNLARMSPEQLAGWGRCLAARQLPSRREALKQFTGALALLQTQSEEDE